jgi:hypothetical protein
MGSSSATTVCIAALHGFRHGSREHRGSRLKSGAKKAASRFIKHRRTLQIAPGPENCQLDRPACMGKALRMMD